MNIEYRAYQITKRLCLNYKLRNRSLYPFMKDDPRMQGYHLLNRELTMLADENRLLAARGFNSAFKQYG